MKTVLIIEDNEQNLYLARYILERGGYTVEAAADGPAGIAAALGSPHSVILLDIQLPGMDGHEVARQLRAHPSLDRTPIIAVTSYAMVGDRERIMQAGCTGYIEKPINPETFLAEVEAFMASQTGEGQPPRALVVDDIETNLYLMESLLRAHGWKSARAANGAEALALARIEPPSLIVSDILMPVMDGFTLCRQWRADPQLCDIPFIFYTATYTASEDERLARNLGADLFLVKPLEPGQLMEMLREVLAAQREGRLAHERKPAEDEQSHLKEYNAALVRKLEDKMEELARLNRNLEERVRDRTTELEAANRELQALSHIGAWTSEIGPPARLKWSAETHRIFGVAPAEFDGRIESFFARVHPADLESLRAARRDAWAGLRPFNFEHRIVQPNGRIRWVHEQAEVERDLHQHPIRMVGVVRDVTDQRQLEEQLRQAQKMEAVGQLAGGLAHDFNNLLTVIQSHAEMVLSVKEVPRAAAESAEQILQASERASALTRRLLTFSRRQAIQVRSANLNQIVSGMTKMLERVVGEQIAIREDLAPTLPPAMIDTGMMEQVIVNLAVNARDAMPKGGELILRTSTLDAAIQAKAGPARFVRLSVSDTGAGIRPEHLPHIFEPFFTTKESGQGTGLGLATVYGIVQQHGGRITVASELGRGTTFDLLMPATDQPVEETRTSSAEPARGGKETLLIVEDESQLRRLVSEILNRQGYRVLEAEHAASALKIWKDAAGEIDLLLTDLVMPGAMSGRELADELRREKPNLKVIFTTGYSAESVPATTSGMAGFLAKPYRADKLAATVRECLDGA